jgi:hypothetical protein
MIWKPPMLKSTRFGFFSFERLSIETQRFDNVVFEVRVRMAKCTKALEGLSLLQVSLVHVDEGRDFTLELLS